LALLAEMHPGPYKALGSREIPRMLKIVTVVPGASRPWAVLGSQSLVHARTSAREAQSLHYCRPSTLRK
jgi:hypothetical protein